MIRRCFLGLAAASLLASCTASPPESDATYYLVRHAEKTTDKKDPALTEVGAQRAQDLVTRLKDISLTKVYSSDYKRTRDTAAPIAKALGLEVVIYNPSDLDTFSKKLLNETGHILVVGHSNTTPPLSALLGGEAGEPIVETTEYDRLYLLKRRGDEITSKIEYYGQKS